MPFTARAQPFGDNAAKPNWQVVLQAALPPSVLAGICIIGSSVSYLLFHALAELFSIVIALTALVVATTSRQFTKNHFVVFIAVAIGWCAALDLLHTLAFKGMGLLPTDSANPATQLWIAARFIQAVALISAPLFLRRSVPIVYLHLGFGLVATLAALSISSGYFPVAYIDAEGLTPFKIYTEYLIILILAGALALIWRNRALMTPGLFFSLLAAVTAMMLSEFSFTRYVSVYANANMLGHVLKIYAYWFVYIALVQNTLREPFSMLARAASTYDAVPDPTLIVSPTGSIIQANQAAARHTGLPAEQLVGADSHALFHNPDIEAEVCPVCTAIAKGNEAFVQELSSNDCKHSVECSVAPFSHNGSGRAYVQVVRDISERKQMALEREALVCNLGERVKELSCLYALSNLIETPDQDIPGLLAGAASALPSAFRFPDQARASIVSDWGNFGTPAVLNDLHRLQRPLRVNREIIGTVAVGYPDSFMFKDETFLPEEASLMDTVALRLGETMERKLASAKIQRLSYLYEMLSATNRAVVRCRSTEELLDALFEALITHGTYPMLFIALAEQQSSRFRIEHHHGIAPEYLPELERVLADLDSSFGQIRSQLLQGEVICLHVPHSGASDQWINYLQQRHIMDRAVMPLVREGRLLGVAGLYAAIPNAFDTDELRLLNEMATDMGFALNTLVMEERRQAAEQNANLSEHRFREVFESSPLPMQIHSISSGAIRALNRAHQQWLGYTPAELRHEDDWFALVYADAAEREALRQQWPLSIAAAKRSAAPVSSPELRLRCKDGSQRIALGSMTVLGDEAIIAWTDLTATRRDEDQIRRYIAQLEGSMKSTLQVVSNMVEMRDPYTAGHERRVGLIAGAIAREMGWTEAQCNEMEMIGLVHDIGKIAIPAEILSKPSRLSNLEMALVRNHAQAGYDILKGVEFSAPVAQIIHQHHERMDGSGYPQGLKGPEIMPEARILAVADVLESMAAHRPYRAALGIDAALGELEQGSGRLYAPEVVAAILRLVREQAYQLPQ